MHEKRCEFSWWEGNKEMTIINWGALLVSLLDLRQFLAIENSLKMMKKASDLMLNVLSILRYLHLGPDFLVMLKNSFIRKLYYG